MYEDIQYRVKLDRLQKAARLPVPCPSCGGAGIRGIDPRSFYCPNSHAVSGGQQTCSVVTFTAGGTILKAQHEPIITPGLHHVPAQILVGGSNAEWERFHKMVDDEFPTIRNGLNQALETLEEMTADAKRRGDMARRVLASYQLFKLEKEHPGLIRAVSGIDDVTARLDTVQSYLDAVDVNVHHLLTYFMQKEWKQRLGLQ
jgi:hypothetical protein